MGRRGDDGDIDGRRPPLLPTRAQLRRAFLSPTHPLPPFPVQPVLSRRELLSNHHVAISRYDIFSPGSTGPWESGTAAAKSILRLYRVHDTHSTSILPACHCHCNVLAEWKSTTLDKPCVVASPPSSPPPPPLLQRQQELLLPLHGKSLPSSVGPQAADRHSSFQSPASHYNVSPILRDSNDVVIAAGLGHSIRVVRFARVPECPLHRLGGAKVVRGLSPARYCVVGMWSIQASLTSLERNNAPWQSGVQQRRNRQQPISPWPPD